MRLIVDMPVMRVETCPCLIIIRPIAILAIHAIQRSDGPMCGSGGPMWGSAGPMRGDVGQWWGDAGVSGGAMRCDAGRCRAMRGDAGQWWGDAGRGGAMRGDAEQWVGSAYTDEGVVADEGLESAVSAWLSVELRADLHGRFG